MPLFFSQRLLTLNVSNLVKCFAHDDCQSLSLSKSKNGSKTQMPTTSNMTNRLLIDRPIAKQEAITLLAASRVLHQGKSHSQALAGFYAMLKDGPTQMSQKKLQQSLRWLGRSREPSIPLNENHQNLHDDGFMQLHQKDFHLPKQAPSYKQIPTA